MDSGSFTGLNCWLVTNIKSNENNLNIFVFVIELSGNHLKVIERPGFYTVYNTLDYRTRGITIRLCIRRTTKCFLVRLFSNYPRFADEYKTKKVKLEPTVTLSGFIWSRASFLLKCSNTGSRMNIKWRGQTSAISVHIFKKYLNFMASRWYNCLSMNYYCNYGFIHKLSSIHSSKSSWLKWPYLFPLVPLEISQSIFS